MAIPRATFSFLKRGACALLVAGLPLGGALTAAEVEFPVQVQPGNIFTVGETVEVEAAIRSGSTVRWVVSSFAGKPFIAGVGRVVDHATLIAPRITEAGYYVLQIEALRGAATVGVGRTTFAVVPRFDIPRMAGSRYGVMTHFATGMPLDSRLLPILEKGGISWIRDEQPWDALEKTKGHYDFPPQDTAYMEAARKANMNVLFDASFGNELYDGQPGVKVYALAPYTPEGYSGYANYCAAVLQRYGPQIRDIEIWNEYNGTFCDGAAAKDRPKHYTELLKAAYAKVKSVRPDVQVLGGAAVKIPMPYLEKLFKLGALDSMDAVAVHPYQTPETVVRSLTELVALTRKYNGGKSKPIWATECGYSYDKTADRAEAASFLVRMMVLESTFPEVQRIIWYLSRDFREFPNMGLVHADTDASGAFTPVMPYVAYANLIHLLSDARFVQREKTDDRTLVYRFESRAQTVWAGWSAVGTAELNFAGPIRRLSIVGSELPPTAGKGSSAVILDATPIFIVAKTGAAVDVTETPRADQLIANSLRDFSSEQGKGGWSYRYIGNNQSGSAPYDPAKTIPMTWQTLPGDWADVWTGPGSYFSLGEEGGSGSVINGGQGWAVLRWTSDRSGLVRITASPRASAPGDGIGVKVFAEGRELFSQLLPPATGAKIDLTTEVSAGTRLDFVVTPGAGTDTNFDNVDWNISILTMPSRSSEAQR